MKKLEHISTRQVAARIRVGTLPDGGNGNVRCACHPNVKGYGQTEALKFWSKGDKIGCTVKPNKWVPALAVHTALGIIIDTRL